MKWQPIETAPKDGSPFLALVNGVAYAIAWTDGLLNSDEDDCGGWYIADYQEPPASWTDGVCCEINGDGQRSAQPTGWKPLTQDATPRLDALRALLERVEAGTATGGPNTYIVPSETSRLIEAALGDDDLVWSAFVSGHDKSIDDAIELLDAMLPGYGFAIERGEAAVWHPDTGGISRDIVRAEPTSRALVIAIIRALIEEAGE
jgi:hypothetical protein